MSTGETTARIASLKREIAELNEKLAKLRSEFTTLESSKHTSTAHRVHHRSSPAEKIALFRDLFVGRPDVYAVRWTSSRTGKSGWSPAVEGGFYASDMGDRHLLPISDDVIERHLIGNDDRNRDFHAGIYPMLQDDTCRLLACDFDAGNWRQDAAAYAAACSKNGIEPAVEISRSGTGAHVWLFFEQPLPALQARALGAALLREAMALQPTISLDSYDRFFPSQDLLPHRATGRMRLGNLIALPLQGNRRREGTTVFVDPESWTVHADQFAYLSTVRKLSPADVEAIQSRLRAKPVTGVFKRQPHRSSELIRLRLRAQLSVPFAGLPAGVIADLKHAASVPNPEFFRKQAQRFSTFGTPRYVRCFEHDVDELRLPRGLLDEAGQILAQAGVPHRAPTKQRTARSLDVRFRGTLNAGQESAVSAMRRHDMGVLVAPPGTGKTVMACRLIAERSAATAIIVNRAELIAQWRERLTQFLGVAEDDIGQLGAGKRKLTGKIDLVMLQSISHRSGDPSVLNGYGHIVIDECHSIAAPAAEAAIRQVAARYWLGLTATPFRADRMDELIMMQCGPIRHSVASAPAVSRRLVVHETAFATDEAGTDGASIQEIYNQLAADGVRNSQIAGDVIRAYGAGRCCLVLANRVEQVQALAAMLRQCGADVYELHGQMPVRDRKQVRSTVASLVGSAFVLVAIDRIAGEGLDLPELDTLFLATPVSFRGRIIQQVGRVTRSAGRQDETAEIHDYHDLFVPVLDRMFRRRLRVVGKEGFRREG